MIFDSPLKHFNQFELGKLYVSASQKYIKETNNKLQSLIPFLILEKTDVKIAYESKWMDVKILQEDKIGWIKIEQEDLDYQNLFPWQI